MADSSLPRPQALLSAAGTVRPSDHGILDGESQNGSVLDLDSDEGEGREAESPARPVVPKGKAKAKSKKSNLRPKSSTDEDVSEPEIVREKVSSLLVMRLRFALKLTRARIRHHRPSLPRAASRVLPPCPSLSPFERAQSQAKDPQPTTRVLRSAR